LCSLMGNVILRRHKTITTFYFTSIGRAKEAALISTSRGLVVLLLCIFTLPMIWSITGVWLIAPAIEVITLILSLVS
jgi:Na+-driven multidrug efflux pump